MIKSFYRHRIIMILLALLPVMSFSQHPSWMYWDPWNALIPSRIITSIAIDEDGIKWLGTEPVCGGGICTDGGLAAFDGVNWIVYDSLNSSLNSNFVESVVISQENVIWAGTGHGEISSFDGTNWQSHPFPGIQENLPITSISIDLYGYIWATTEGNGLFIYDGMEWHRYYSGNSALPDYLRSVEAGPDNAVWTGGTGDKLYKYTGSWEQIDLPEEIYFTSEIAIDQENRVWIGSDGVFCLYYGGIWTVFDENITGIADSTLGYVFDITFDHSGNTWIAHSEGLIRYDGTEWVTFMPENSGMISKHVMSLAADNLGNMWIGTSDTGLIAYNPGGVVGAEEFLAKKADPASPKLAEPFPNPCTQNCTISLEVNESTMVRLDIVDMKGNIVKILADEELPAGRHFFSWDGNNRSGKSCRKGIYLLRLSSKGLIQTKKISLQ